MLLKIKCTYESFGGLNECEAWAGGGGIFPPPTCHQRKWRKVQTIQDPFQRIWIHAPNQHTLYCWLMYRPYMAHSTERTFKVDCPPPSEHWNLIGSPACRHVSRQPGSFHFSPRSTRSDQKRDLSRKQRQKGVEKGLCLGALLVRVFHVTYEWELPVHYVMIHSEMRKTARLTAWAAGGRTFMP